MYYDKLLQLCPLLLFYQIAENDVLPKQICLECYDKVQETYKFLQQCLNSEKLLRDHVAKVEEMNNDSLPVITESAYEQDCSMTEEVPLLTRIPSKRGHVSRIKEFFESHTLKNSPSKENVARALDFDQKMSCEEIALPQDATINSTVVTDLDSEECISKSPVPEDFVTPETTQIKAPVALKRTSSRRQLKCLYQTCGLRFETKMERRKHLETHLNGGVNLTRTKSNWKCKHCEAKFQNPELLLVHEKQHASQVLHGCDKCYKRFKTKANLIAHQRIHCNAKEKYKCKICFKEFTHVSTLYVHQIIHKPDAAQALLTLRS